LPLLPQGEQRLVGGVDLLLAELIVHPAVLEAHESDVELVAVAVALQRMCSSVW
jgi:hypothetical protein